MAVLRDEDVARTFLLAVIARHNRFKEARERGVVQRPSRQFHRLRDAEALANVLDNLVRADLTLHGAGARVARFRNQGDPAGGNQQQNRKALANLDVQWMGLLSHWMDGAARTLGTPLHHPAAQPSTIPDFNEPRPQNQFRAVAAVYDRRCRFLSTFRRSQSAATANGPVSL